MCSGCDRRGPEEDLDRDGLCDSCREQTHYCLGDVEIGPARSSCECAACGAVFRPRPWRELISTPSIKDLRDDRASSEGQWRRLTKLGLRHPRS
jgi:hypothetical protein